MPISPSGLRPHAALLAAALLAAPLGAGAAAQTIAPSAPPPPNSYLLQVALLVGDREGPGSLDDLPPNARRAIEDVRDFLPFKGYRLVDVAVVRSSGEGHARINGPGGEDFEIGFDFNEVEGEADRLHVRHFALRNRTPVPVADDAPSPTEAARAMAGRAAGGSLIGTSFSVDIGETIVVGTSKLNGDGRALIVLLTAIP